MRTRISGVLITTVFLLFFSMTAFAQEGDPAPCTGENVSGMVVAVDSVNGVVTIDTGDGMLCTVTLSPGDYSHPIVALLGQYFDDVNPEALGESLDALHGCALEDAATMTWIWVNCDTPDAVPVTVMGENPDGSFSAMVDSTGDVINVQISDPDQAAGLSDNLAALLVSWSLGEGATVIEAGDMIEGLHDDGMGFGVIVKLFAIAQESQEACMLVGAQDETPCGVSVEELVSAFQDQGMGVGQLFKVYGKPSLLGVGHIKQQLREDKGKPPWAGQSEGTDVTSDDDGTSIPTGNGNGPNKDKNNGPPENAGPKVKPDKGNNKKK
jgi:hypothetical protein